MKPIATIRTTAVLFLPLLFAGGVRRSAERFEIDRNHSRVGFAARHMGVATVRGEFADFQVRVDRREFKLLWNNMVEGVNVVGDEVRLELAIEAVTARPQTSSGGGN